MSLVTREGGGWEVGEEGEREISRLLIYSYDKCTHPYFIRHHQLVKVYVPQSWYNT